MNRVKRVLALALAVVLAMSLLLPAFAAEEAASSVYTYTFKLRVDNPCNSNDMDKDAVCVLFFEYNYTTQNGFGTKKTEKFDMSWKNGKNNNADFLKQHFIRPNDNGYDTAFTVNLPGKLNRVHIKLNMDGGERLSFTVKQITCGGVVINGNTDYVSSAYYDSEATVNCAMANSLIDAAASPFFAESGTTALTQTQLNAVVADVTDAYVGQFVDQFGAAIDPAVVSRCVGSSDGNINQALSHRDEASYYCYTLYMTVENPVNLSDVNGDDVEEFRITFRYTDGNGYGKTGSYTLDMSYDEALGRNRNPDYLNHFERNNDDEYRTAFSVWVPGIVTEVTCLLNMSSERLTVDFDKITVNGLAVNTERDYVSSAFWDSEARIPCRVPAAGVKLAEKTENIADTLKKADRTALRDQYGALVSDTLFDLARSQPTAYVYRYYDMVK